MPEIENLLIIPTYLEALNYIDVLGAHLLKDGKYHLYSDETGKNYILITGEGKNRAKESFKEVLEHYTAKRAILCGFAGGLRDELESGDICSVKEFRKLQFDEKGRPAETDSIDLAMINNSSNYGGMSKSVKVKHSNLKLLSSGRFIGSPDKKHLISRFCTSDIVDMEGHELCKLAMESNVAFYCFKVILDTKSENIDSDIGFIFDDFGRVKIKLIVKLFIKRPGKIFYFLKMFKNFKNVKCQNFQLAKILKNAL